MIKVSPSIMCADFSRLGAEIKKLEKAGADLFHFDIMDGCFVPNITMGPLVLKALRDKTSLPFDAHLMVCQPEKIVKMFIESGSNIITLHIETIFFPYRLIRELKKEKVKVGIAINPATPVFHIEPLLPEIDMVLVMAVEPGFAGGSFIPAVVSKIRKIKEMVERGRLNVEIGVDGGVNEKTLPILVEAGANILIGGSTSIFPEGKIRLSAIKDMKGKWLKR
ncbi:MAG: ribulose-phosphate 3-epimerase [Candidatus Omnitrophota bacterium]